MKKLLLFTFLSLYIASPFYSYTQFYYVEQWYSLFSRKLQERPTDYLNNIYYLERALHSPFGNPRFALTPIETMDQWKKYQYLFYVHLNLKIIEQYLLLGNKFDIPYTRFYFYPVKEALLENLEKAEDFYKIALEYWPEVLKWKEKAEAYRFLELEKVNYWQDEVYRINENELNYEQIINRHLERLAKHKEELLQLNENSY